MASLCGEGRESFELLAVQFFAKPFRKHVGQFLILFHACGGTRARLGCSRFGSVSYPPSSISVFIKCRTWRSGRFLSPLEKGSSQFGVCKGTVDKG